MRMGNGVGVPLVSIGMPVRNGEPFLRASVESLLCQTFEDFELVISDNASTDATGDIIRGYERQDPRVRVLASGVDRGLAWNWNRLLPLTSGKFFKWAAADDIHLPDYLQRAVALLERDGGAVLAHCATGVLNEEGEVRTEVASPYNFAAETAHERFFELTRRHGDCGDVYGLMRRDVLMRTGLHGAFPRSDRVLLAELGLYGRLERNEECLFLRREHRARVTRIYSLNERYAVYSGRRNPQWPFPTWRLFGQYSNALWRSTLGARDKALCGRSLARSMWLYRRFLLREVAQPQSFARRWRH
jgi:glycosyltransferase involved in cell wall biosynthesis